MSEETKGKVYLIGAGPGVAELITWRGLELLATADVVCFDALVDPTLVVTLPPTIERIYVGKRAGQHSKPQDEITQLLVKLASEGRTVARLKGGDPFIFGRGGEEARELVKAGIPFEIVPGVTAASAATAYCGIPLTCRGEVTVASLFTAHEDPDKDEAKRLNYHRLAELDGTLAGYMGIARLPQVVELLITGGRDPETPAAVIERGATPAQRMVKAPLKDLPAEVEKAGLKPPALIVVGKTVAMSEGLQWYRPGPLAGKRVLVTRPADQAGPMYNALKKLGAWVVPAPAIRTQNHLDLKGWESFNNLLEKPGWLVFTSENGVRFFMRNLFRIGGDIRILGMFRIAVIGAGTKRALGEMGVQADFVPSTFTGKTLGEELGKHIIRGDNVVRVRGNLGEPVVETLLDQAGAKVLPLQVYVTETAPLDDGVRAWVREAPLDYVTFTSGSTATSFVEQWGDEGRELVDGAKVVSIGPMTSNVVRELGFQVDLQAEPHDVEGIVATILADVASEKPKDSLARRS